MSRVDYNDDPEYRDSCKIVSYGELSEPKINDLNFLQ